MSSVVFTEISLKITDDLIIDIFNQYSTEGILFINNIDILNKNLNIDLPKNNNITLESFQKALNNHKTIKLKQTIGQKLSFNDYQYIVNPYESTLDIKISRSDDNIVLTQDKYLLFKYGNNIDNIYYVFADEILSDIAQEEEQFYILKLYFPKLFNIDNIKSLNDLQESRLDINDKILFSNLNNNPQFLLLLIAISLFINNLLFLISSLNELILFVFL